MMLMRCFYVVVFSSDSMYKSVMLGVPTINICFYKEVDKKYTVSNLKTTELLDCVLIGVCVVARWNMVCFYKEVDKSTLAEI